jgi:hypothetical protein
MALTNAEKQKRWREKRNALAHALTGGPKDVAEQILRELGVDKTKKVVRALDKRLRAIRRYCPACGGTGYMAVYPLHCSGEMLGGPITAPCPCLDCMEPLAETQARLRARPPAA